MSTCILRTPSKIKHWILEILKFARACQNTRPDFSQFQPVILNLAKRVISISRLVRVGVKRHQEVPYLLKLEWVMKAAPYSWLLGCLTKSRLENIQLEDHLQV